MFSRTIGAPPSTLIDTLSHLSVLALLPEYVTPLALGQVSHQDWRPLELHLAECAACRAEADTLLQHMVETYTGRLPAAPLPFSAQLPFLARRPAPFAAPARPHPLPEPPAPYRVQISAALLSSMQVRLAARGGELHLRYAYTFPTLKANDPSVTVEILSADDTPDRGVARICVEFADRGPFDQAGSCVTLTGSHFELKATTDSAGLVIFPDVPLDALAEWHISIQPHSDSDGE